MTAPTKGVAMKARRMGMVIAVRPEKLPLYKDLHAHPWPEMNAALKRANIRNYSIYLREPENLLFGCWEYVGADFPGDFFGVVLRWIFARARTDFGAFAFFCAEVADVA